jgi:hypothetical protein
MVLMGLGQGAYLGKKLTTIDTPRLTGLSAGSGLAGSPLTIYGLSFGTTQNGGLITIDGNAFYPDAPVKWEDTQITFQLPLNSVSTERWTFPQRISVGITAEGQPSANSLPFTITGSVPAKPAAGAGY